MAADTPGDDGRPGVLVAVDGGGSKTDAVALGRDGRLLGYARGPRSSPQLIGLAPAVEVIDDLVTRVAADAPVDATHLYLSGLDLPVEIRALEHAVADRPWARSGLHADNDLFALLRAGTGEPDAAAVVCGTGINALAVRADGEVARFAALGAISGDWGGGGSLGSSALWFAARAVDGRGEPTALVEAVPRALGVASIPQLIEDLHLGFLEDYVLASLAPLVLRLAREGDDVAGSIVDRLAREVATMAVAALRRLGLDQREVPVVLGGGVLTSGDVRLLGQVRTLLAAEAPHAVPVVIDAAPIVGASRLVLEAAGAAPEAVLAGTRAVTRALIERR
ncbi:MAG: N-acetylglucosamine kinase [Actinobacteria bacterium]|nr:N-acetylglucosamine kinase [Actinomycetota bacterium]